MAPTRPSPPVIRPRSTKCLREMIPPGSSGIPKATTEEGEWDEAAKEKGRKQTATPTARCVRYDAARPLAPLGKGALRAPVASPQEGVTESKRVRRWTSSPLPREFQHPSTPPSHCPKECAVGLAPRSLHAARAAASACPKRGKHNGRPTAPPGSIRCA